MTALYKKDRGLSAGVKILRDKLQSDGIVFIPIVHTVPKHQGRGLRRPMMLAYRQMLQTLPEWFVFLGALVLVSAAPSDERSDMWKGLDGGEVETFLRAIYERADNFQCLVTHRVGAYGINVLARVVVLTMTQMMRNDL